jgi:hypothetical protein
MASKALTHQPAAASLSRLILRSPHRREAKSRGDFKPKRLGRPEVHDHLKFCRQARKIEIEISISLCVFKCTGALKSYRDEFAIAGKERAAQRSDDVPNGRKLAMDLLFPRSAKS